MKTQVLPVTAQSLAMAGRIIREGGLVGMPTETVYGLGGNALDAQAALRIFEAKGRPADNPLIVHVASVDEIPPLVRAVPQAAKKLMEAFWPGPMTLILPKADCIPGTVSAGLDTVGIRLPQSEAARAMIRAAGVPIAAPSANTSGRPSCTTAADVREDMDGKIEAIVDGGPCRVGVESTIVDLTGERPRLLRPGGLPLELLEEVCGTVEVDKAVTQLLAPGEQPKAPGMKYRHYAPKAPVTVVTGNAEQAADYILDHIDEKGGVICFDEFAPLFEAYTIEKLGSVFDKDAQARHVFDALRAFDTTDVTEIWAQCPDSTGLGLAVANRLQKAAGFHVIAAGGEGF